MKDKFETLTETSPAHYNTVLLSLSPSLSPPLSLHPAFCCVFPLQSEDKIKAIANLYGPLMAFNHMVQQEYFPKALAPLLLAFVTK